MRRREFVGLVGGAAVSAILRSRAAWSQDERRMRLLGWLIARAEADPLEQAGRTVLREGLAKLGWIEGRNLRIEVRFAADNLNRLHTNAAELVNLVPDVIVSSSAVATKSATQIEQQNIALSPFKHMTDKQIAISLSVSPQEKSISRFVPVRHD